MRQDKHCCYQNDRNIVLIPFCPQLLIWSLWASQINSVIHPGILPAPKEIPSKTPKKNFLRVISKSVNLCATKYFRTSMKTVAFAFSPELTCQVEPQPTLTQWICTSGTAVQQMQLHFDACQICCFTVQSLFTQHLSSFWEPSQLTLMFPLQLLFWPRVSFTSPRFQLT